MGKQIQSQKQGYLVIMQDAQNLPRIQIKTYDLFSKLRHALILIRWWSLSDNLQLQL